MNNPHGLPDALLRALNMYFHCPICNAPVSAPIRVDNKDKKAWDCETCGPYRMAAQADSRLTSLIAMDPELRPRLIEWIAEQHTCPEITLDTIECCQLKNENDSG